MDGALTTKGRAWQRLWFGVWTDGLARRVQGVSRGSGEMLRWELTGLLMVVKRFRGLLKHLRRWNRRKRRTRRVWGLLGMGKKEEKINRRKGRRRRSGSVWPKQTGQEFRNRRIYWHTVGVRVGHREQHNALVSLSAWAANGAGTKKRVASERGEMLGWGFSRPGRGDATEEVVVEALGPKRCNG